VLPRPMTATVISSVIVTTVLVYRYAFARVSCRLWPQESAISMV
jgi:hypothetical protein